MGLEINDIRMGWPGVSSQEFHDICGERDGVDFATKKSMPSRRHPSG